MVWRRLRETGSKTRMRLLRAQLTHARPAAKITSAGSSAQGMVAVVMPLLSEMTEMLSLASLTTHASSLERARTLTGSCPVWISVRRAGKSAAAPWISKTQRRPSVLERRRRVDPSGVISAGCTSRASKCAWAVWACAAGCRSRKQNGTESAMIWPDGMMGIMCVGWGADGKNSPGHSRETGGEGWWRLRWAMARAVNPQRKTPAVRRYPVGGHAHSGALQIGSDGEWRRDAVDPAAVRCPVGS